MTIQFTTPEFHASVAEVRRAAASLSVDTRPGRPVRSATLLDGWHGAAADGVRRGVVGLAEILGRRSRRRCPALADSLTLFQTDITLVDDRSAVVAARCWRDGCRELVLLRRRPRPRPRRSWPRSPPSSRELDEVVVDLRWRVARLHETWAGTAAAAHLDAHGSWEASYREMHEALRGDARRPSHRRGQLLRPRLDNASMWSAVR